MKLNRKTKTFAAAAVIIACSSLIPAQAHAAPGPQPAYASSTQQPTSGTALIPKSFGKTAVVITQSIVIPTHATIEVAARDSYSATTPPPPPATMVASAGQVNRWVGGTAPAQSYSGSAVVEYAKQFVGTVPYGSGNNPADSFSCDGLVQYVFAQFGIQLPRMVGAQAARGTQISAAEAQPGDLVVWPGQHIGIYAGAGMMVDSPKPGMYVSYRALWGAPQFFRLG